MSQTTPQMIALGARLKKLRERAGISARELGRLAGLLDESYPARIESAAKAGIEVGTLSSLCAVLGSSLDYLVNDEGTAPTDDEIKLAVKLARRRAAAAGSPVDADPLPEA